MAKATQDPALPDWWQREKQRRQYIILIFLSLLLILIGYFYVVSANGRIGSVRGIDFDSANYIAFTHLDKAGNASLYAVRADGSDTRRLTAADDVSSKQDPAWTLDGKNLLYATNKNDKQVVQIYLMGGGEAKQLTYGAGNKFAPVASPDGKSIGFVTQGAIKTVLLNGERVEQALPPPRAGNSEGSDAGPGEIDPHGPFQFPHFSADGRGLASVQFLSGEDNPDDVTKFGDQLARAVFPGGDKDELLNAGREISVAWEPNGERLACAYAEFQPSEPDAPHKIVSGITFWKFEPAQKDPAKRLQGTPVLIANDFSMEPRNLVWSPDGKTLAFECWRLKGEGVREPLGLVLLGADQKVSVTAAQVDQLPFIVKAGRDGFPQNPRWSPDGSRLLFEVMRPDGKHDLCLINADGTNPSNLTASLGGDNTQGAWGPKK